MGYLSRDSLNLLCAHFGLDAGYQDIWGRTVEALPEVIEAALNSVSGGQIPEQAFHNLAAAEAFIAGRQANRWFPTPILADSINAPFASCLLPEGVYALTIQWEGGGAASLELHSNGVNPPNWPPDHALYPGYHQIRLHKDGREESITWILSPGSVFREPDDKRGCGLSCFLPSLRSQQNWGCGDFRDLGTFAQSFADSGFDFIALNPLHALANRLPYNASPYSPLSLLRLNFIYLAIEQLPEFARSAAAQHITSSVDFQTRLQSLRDSEYVDYESVARIKHFALKLLFREFLRNPDPAFAAWRTERAPWLDQFGAYMATWRYLHKRNPNLWIWQDWPEEFQRPDTPSSQSLQTKLKRQIEFEAWVQWRLEQQLASVAEQVKTYGYRLGLYSDLAVACDKAGPDRWANHQLFAQGLRIGSPPDDFNVNGQDWGFPALRPLNQCPEVLGYFRESLRACARSAGVIRLDHVMRLARLYSIPDGRPAREGVYIRDHFKALLHIIALESHRQQALVVGEDLGTVPEYFRSALDEFGILSYRLVMFEWYGSELKPAEHYPANALCSFSTHDLATFDGYLSAADLELRRSVGFLSEDSMAHALDERRRNLQAFLRAFGGDEHLSSPDTLFALMIGFLLRTPSRLVLIGLDELLAEKTQMNLPGTTSEHPNWRLKTRIPLEAMRQDDTLTIRLKAWNTARQSSPEVSQ